jgi:hypothetical protein
VAAVTVQLCTNIWLLHREFARRLPSEPVSTALPAA